MSVLLALALAAAPGCPAALEAAAELPDAALATRAAALVQAVERAGAGPTAALAAAARDLADAGAATAQEGAAASFRGALATHCALSAAPPLPDASAADRAALAEVLARPELSHVRLDPWALRRALVSFWGWIVELLGTQEAERYASLGRALLLGAAAAALTLAVAAARRRRLASRAGRAREDEVAATGDGAPELGAAHAEAALGRGDAMGAIRLALLAALGALERAGRVPRGRALTNEEVVRIVGQAGSTSTSTAAEADLAVLVRAFDRAVYGGLSVTTDEARAAVERARRVVNAAGGAP